MPVGPEGDEESLTVLDLTLGNFAAVGLTEVAIVVGYRKEAVYARQAALEAKYGLKKENVVLGCGSTQLLTEAVQAYTSNAKPLVSGFPTYEDHPLGALREAGVRVTLGSDDPPYFGCSIGAEYAVAREHHGFEVQQLIDVTRLGV